MVLLRQLLGDVLRRLRIRQGRTLREVSASARVSLGYLSEVERGRKEASSELLAAICAALETPLSQVFREVSDNFALAELQQDTVLGAPREPALRQASLRIAANRVPVPAETPDAAAASLGDVPSIDVASVGEDFGNRRAGVAGPAGRVRARTPHVPRGN
jgi:transcriptional regulator with XRE-family HTH domain